MSAAPGELRRAIERRRLASGFVDYMYDGMGAQVAKLRGPARPHTPPPWLAEGAAIEAGFSLLGEPPTRLRVVATSDEVCLVEQLDGTDRYAADTEALALYWHAVAAAPEAST